MTDIEEIVARYALDNVTTEEMVEVGLFALDQGFSSAEVVELAGLTKPLFRREAEPLFQTVLAQMGKSIPSVREAAFYLATQFAKRIASGEITPAAGVAAIAPLWEPSGNADVLTPFYAQEDALAEAMIGLEFASDELRQQKEEHIQRINVDIVNCARKLIETRK